LTASNKSDAKEEDRMDTNEKTLILDGAEVTFKEGETLYQLSTRHQKEIPTLCYDARLDAFGGCRLCIVELEGAKNPVASCTTQAAAGMVVKTSSPRIERHRKTLLEMVASENRETKVDALSGYASGELATLLARHSAQPGRFKGRLSGRSRPDDPNPFILRDYENCISCYRCVRVCAEREGDYAISVKGRGFDTQITAPFDGHLKDSSCTFCGQCVQTCPTGALGNKKALSKRLTPGETKTTRTICPYCGVGCSIDIQTRGDKIVGVLPAMDGPANLGALCVKGQFAFDFVQHPDRLAHPMVRGEDGALRRASWGEALDRAAKGFLEAAEKHGRHSVYGIASGRAPHEAAYTMQKFIRAGFGTNYIDNCSRA
jgi:predicted molibdopterin-dependent oxidoreductase YjgC